MEDWDLEFYQNGSRIGVALSVAGNMVYFLDLFIFSVGSHSNKEYASDLLRKRENPQV